MSKVKAVKAKNTYYCRVYAREGLALMEVSFKNREMIFLCSHEVGVQN